jgi:hypothetical protein
VRQQVRETYKLKLTNKYYKYYEYKGLESGKQVVGPLSAQALVDWRLRYKCPYVCIIATPFLGI